MSNQESDFIRRYRESLDKGEEAPTGEAFPIESLDGKALSSPVTKVDPDTVKIGDQSYRLSGFNAPETAKFQGGIFVPGQVAGDRTQANIEALAKAGGFTNLVPTGKTDPYGRKVADVQNKAGQNLGDLATALGLTDVNLYTEDAVLSQQRIINAAAAAFPGLASADPVMRIAIEEKRKREEEANGRPQYLARVNAPDEKAYAAIKSMVGIKAVNEQLKEIDRLNELLADPALEPRIRDKLEKKLETARDALFVAGTTPDFVAGVKWRHNDRTMMNQAHDQFWQSVDNGWNNVKQGFYGMGELIGDTQQWEWLSEKARDNTIRLKHEQGNAADILGSIRDIRTGDWWDTTKDVATYASNLIGGTLPQMSILIGATFLTAPIGGVGGLAASAVPGSLLYAGQYYTEQPEENKNAGLAVLAGVGSGILDRVGLEGWAAGKALAGDLFTNVGKKAAIEQLMKPIEAGGKAMTKEAAEDALKGASRAEILKLTTFGEDFAKRHFATKEARLAALKQFGMATGSESSTESAQQLLEMIAKTGDANFDVRYEKYFYQQLIDAAIGGGLMGGAFNVGGTALDMAQWHSAADAKAAFENDMSDAMQYRALQEQKKRIGQERFAPTSTFEAIQKVMENQEGKEPPSLLGMEGKPGIWNGFMSIVKDPVRMLRQLGTTTVRSLRNADGTFRTYLPILRQIMSGGVLDGNSFDGTRQDIIGQWSTVSADELATRLKTNTKTASQMLQKAWIDAWSKGPGERLDTTNPQNAILQDWKDNADLVNANVKEFMRQAGSGIDFTNDFDTIFEEAAIDPQNILKNTQMLVEEMVAKGSNDRRAAEAVSNLVSGNPELARAAKEYMSKYEVFKNPKLAHLFEPDIFTAFENYKHRMATQAAKNLYLGKDGIVLATLLQLAKDNGEFGDNHDAYLDAVQNTQDFYKIANGTYNSLEHYPFIEKVLGWGVTMTMLASLGKAAISSIPEAAMATLGTPGHKIGSQLFDAASTFMTEYKDDFNKGISYSTSVIGMSYAREHPNVKIQEEYKKIRTELDALKPEDSPQRHAELSAKVKKLHKKMIGRNLFDRLGFSDSGFNTQAKFETSSANMKRAMHVFASFIGLRAQTDATRIALMSVGADIISTRLMSLMAIPAAERDYRFNTGTNLSNEQYQGLKELMRYGMNVKETLAALEVEMEKNPLLTKEKVVENKIEELALGTPHFYGMGDPRQILKDNFMTTLRNMVDARVVNPQIGNLPKYYHDPRLRIFTAMTRFIAGMTANILPRLYRDYIKDGNVGMRYQAFVVMSMAVLFAHLANIMKDTLSYGDDDNPYIKSNFKKTQRAIQGAGLLGRLDQVVEGFAPLYPSTNTDFVKNPVGSTWNTFKNNAPPVSWADRAVRAMYNIGHGDTEKGVKGAIRSAPLVGSFPIVADTAVKMMKE